MISSPFAITAATNLVRLDTKNSGRGAFTVSNQTLATVRGRAQAVPERPEQAHWLHLDGDAERDFAANGTQQYSVTVLVDPETPTGRHTFRLDMHAVAPASGVTQGPSVAFEITTVVPRPPRDKAGYLATLFGALIGAVVGGVVGSVPGAIFALVKVSSSSVDAVLAVILIGVLVLSAPCVGLGAWINLRARGYEGARDTGLMVAGAYTAWAVVVGLVYGLVLRLTSTQVGVSLLIVVLIAALVPPVPARVLYLQLKSAGRIGSQAR